MRKLTYIAAAIAVGVSMLACTISTGPDLAAAATAYAQTLTAEALIPPAPAQTAAPLLPCAPSPTPTLVPPPTACSPLVTANVDANVRAGDSTSYEIIGFLGNGDSTPLLGRNGADTWWYIAYGGGQGWIAKSISTGSCLPGSVAVVVPPPLPPTPTNVPGSEEFAVIHVTYSFSQADYGGHSDCPQVTAHVTTNGPGDVTYQWKRSDGANAPFYPLHFNSAGTLDVTTNWALGHTWEGTEFWLGLYIDDPNHQQFGQKSFTDACDG